MLVPNTIHVTLAKVVQTSAVQDTTILIYVMTHLITSLIPTSNLVQESIFQLSLQMTPLEIAKTKLTLKSMTFNQISSQQLMISHSFSDIKVVNS